MSTLFLPLSDRARPVSRITSTVSAQRSKSLAACLCAMLIATPGTLFAKDAHPAVKPGMHFYLNTKGSFGCFSKKALVEHVKHLKMGNGPEAKRLQEDDVKIFEQCFAPYGIPLAKSEYVVVSVENISGVDGRVVGYEYVGNPGNFSPAYTLIKYVTPAQTPNSSDAK